MKWMNLNVVILDDDVMRNQTIKKNLIEKHIRNVSNFYSVVDCVKSIDIVPDIIFIELNMQDVSGVSAARIIKRKWRYVRIVILSSTRKRIKKRKFGINKVIVKSDNVSELINEIWLIKTRRIMRLLSMVFILIIGAYLISIA